MSYKKIFDIKYDIYGTFFAILYFLGIIFLLYQILKLFNQIYQNIILYANFFTNRSAKGKYKI